MKKIEYNLDYENDDFRHWIEIKKISDTQFNVEKKDSKPVFNEDKYVYKLDENGVLECKRGSHSCSTGSRRTSPGAELDETVKSLIKERFIKVRA